MSATMHAPPPERNKTTATTQPTSDSNGLSGDVTISAGPLVGDTEMVSVDGDTYMQLPKGMPFGSGKHWWRFSTDQTDADCPGPGPDGLAMVAGGVKSSTGALDDLRTHGDALIRIGTETVRGVETTHWRAPERSARVCNGPGDPHTDITESIDVWTDKDDRARRLHLSSKAKMTFDGETTSMNQDTTTEFFDFGVDVNISAPPPSDVFDMSSVFEDQKKGPGSVDPNAWTSGAQGTDGSTPWHVDWAPSSTGWRCYDVVGIESGSDEPLDLDPAQKMPVHDGHPVTDCMPPHAFMGSIRVFVSTQQRTHSIVGALPGTTTIRIAFKDGTSQDVAVDDNSWLFSWTGDRVPERLSSDAGSCSLEPMSLNFDPGTTPSKQDADRMMQSIPCSGIDFGSELDELPSQVCTSQSAPAPPTTPTTIDPSLQKILDDICSDQTP
jgi:hypothetical protein